MGLSQAWACPKSGPVKLIELTVVVVEVGSRGSQEWASEVDPRLAIDELLKDCPGAPLVITLQQLPG
jgi:hypothetical protein